MPEAVNLARAEARQLAFVENLTRYADRRAAANAAMMRKLGVNPQMLAPRDTGEAMGGPLLPLSTNADGSIDPRFARLGASLSRMSALDQALSRMPQVLPASMDSMSSGFGYRSDPFTHHGSFHPGLDFRGPLGAPIYAAARGVVSFVGQRSGYGNCVEVTHGPGLVTRYAHMSAFRTHVGQQVTAGQTIGVIGSTGRSTGPHLHFEVRISDRPVNPRHSWRRAAMFHRKPSAQPPVQTRVATDAMSNTSTFSMIGADVVINGDVSATADLHIDGRIQGDITCTSLVQGASSEMIGAIVAQSAHMAGTVRGSITVSDLVIQRSAHIIGDVNYEALTIEQGARVEGKFAKANAEAPVETGPLMLQGE
jgi:murein DD-endopeptidase MepM/ murein hydrolase activator NlpD/cytoskeletal protein CcmA (bactofilin family)